MVSVKRIITKAYMKRILRKEQTYKNEECNLNYLFIEKKKSDRLLVVFSGFPPANQKGGYNYVLKFRDFDCNKLYILDDFGNDSRGSYYLGENKNFFIERAVSQLIEKIASEKNIPLKNIITAGSSKGGFAALYFAFKNGYGTAVSGGSQVLLGNYLAIPGHENILSYITGGRSNKEVEYLNGVLLDLVTSTETSPHLYLHVGKNDHHYQDHTIPLLDVLKSKDFKYNLDLADYENHSDLGKHYPIYARNMIQRKLTGQYDNKL